MGKGLQLDGGMGVGQLKWFWGVLERFLILVHFKFLGNEDGLIFHLTWTSHRWVSAPLHMLAMFLC